MLIAAYENLTDQLVRVAQEQQDGDVPTARQRDWAIDSPSELGRRIAEASSQAFRDAIKIRPISEAGLEDR